MSEQQLTASAIISFSTDLEARSQAFYQALGEAITRVALVFVFNYHRAVVAHVFQSVEQSRPVHVAVSGALPAEFIREVNTLAGAR